MSRQAALPCKQEDPPKVGILQLFKHTIAQLDAKGVQKCCCVLERLKHSVCPVTALAHITHARQDVVQGACLLLCLLGISLPCAMQQGWFTGQTEQTAALQ